MTLARKVGDDLQVGGVFCRNCGRDRYFSTKRQCCVSCGKPGDYEPRGLVVKERDENGELREVA